jgi:hypothetical protein
MIKLININESNNLKLYLQKAACPYQGLFIYEFLANSNFLGWFSLK